MALVFALYLLLCVRVTADIRAGLADGRIQFAASVGTLMLEARIDGSVEGAKVRLNIPIRGFPEKPDGKKIRQSWPAARTVLKAADWELIALHMRAGLEDAGATAMFAGGIRAVADGLLAGLGRTGCSDIRVTADFAARGVWAAAATPARRAVSCWATSTTPKTPFWPKCRRSLTAPRCRRKADAGHPDRR